MRAIAMVWCIALCSCASTAPVDGGASADGGVRDASVFSSRSNITLIVSFSAPLDACSKHRVDHYQLFLRGAPFDLAAPETVDWYAIPCGAYGGTGDHYRGIAAAEYTAQLTACTVDDLRVSENLSKQILVSGESAGGFKELRFQFASADFVSPTFGDGCRYATVEGDR